MSEDNGLTTDIPRRSQRHRLGPVALTLWAIAITFVPVDAESHGRVLTYTGDLLVIFTACASMATLLWYLDRYLVSHLINWRVGIEYGYRAGYSKGHCDGRRACDRSSTSGEHLADVFLIEPMRHDSDRRAVLPEMRHTGDRFN